MPTSTPIVIRPVTDLAKKMSEIETLCVEQDLPVFISKKGSNYLTIMSHDHYEQLISQIRLYEKLLIAEGESRRGEMIDFNSAMDEIESEIFGGVPNDSDHRQVSG